MTVAEGVLFVSFLIRKEWFRGCLVVGRFGWLCIGGSECYGVTILIDLVVLCVISKVP